MILCYLAYARPNFSGNTPPGFSSELRSNCGEQHGENPTPFIISTRNGYIRLSTSVIIPLKSSECPTSRHLTLPSPSIT